MAESAGREFDLDNNGFTDREFQASEFNQIRDTDNDGIPDHLDLDSNNNGVFDLVEAGGSDFNDDGTVDFWTDTDGDNRSDWIDADMGPRPDHDGDGIANSADIDCFREGTGQWGHDLDYDLVIDGYAATTYEPPESNYPNRYWTILETDTFRSALGYVHMFQEQHLVSEFDEFDSNRNCISDTAEGFTSETTSQETSTPEIPQENMQNDQAPESQKSGGGGGCTIRAAHHSQHREMLNIDPLFVLIVVCCLFRIKISRTVQIKLVGTRCRRECIKLALS